LDDHRFDEETLRLMGIAFEMALASLRSTLHHTDPIFSAPMATPQLPVRGRPHLRLIVDHGEHDPHL
jgi:hypothetical protein